MLDTKEVWMCVTCIISLFSQKVLRKSGIVDSIYDARSLYHYLAMKSPSLSKHPSTSHDLPNQILKEQEDFYP